MATELFATESTEVQTEDTENIRSEGLPLCDLFFPSVASVTQKNARSKTTNLEDFAVPVHLCS